MPHRRGTHSRLAITKRHRSYTARRRRREAFSLPPTEHIFTEAVPTNSLSADEPSNVAVLADSVREYTESLEQLGRERLSQQTDSQHLRDGSGLSAALPTRRVLEEIEPVSRELHDIVAIFDTTVDQFGLERLVSSIDGSPSKSVVEDLDRTFHQAATFCRASLAARLNCSTRCSRCGSQIRADLLRGLVAAVNDPDRSLAETVDEGVELGIDRPIPATGLFPTYDKKREDESLQLLRLHQLANYTSVEASSDITENLILEEVNKGRMRRLSESESAATDLTFARMALLTKSPKSPGDPPSYRIVDDYRRNGLNARMSCAETVSLPRLVDLRRTMADLLGGLHSILHSSDTASVFSEEDLLPHFFEYDIASAFRNLFMHPRDRRRLCVRVNGHCYQHLALPFGVRLAPYHWCRFAACVIRLLGKILRCILRDLPYLNLGGLI
ncbi:hypothetical protein FOZ63_017769 [Perkinsus olseni]|uniref:Uncharacterized protein n=1 Tax=Perkinsus olseni TaxID=32597 RepID=A0A7J6QGC0_PEROL|nr:hypothetical protein FOZ63_017769 [Perkinsus olseni]